MSSEADSDGDVTGQALVARELRRHRERAGLNLSQLAKRVGYSRTYISTSEKPGADLVSEEVVRRIDQELGAGGELIELRARADAARKARRNPAAAEISSERLAPSTKIEGPAIPINRRTFNAGLVGVGISTSIGHGRLDSLNQRRPVDPLLVTYFQNQLKNHYVVDSLLGPGALVEVVSSQLNLIAALLEGAETEVRLRLAKVGSAFSSFLAWLQLDAGDIPASFAAHGLALELAHRSHDREAIACALVDRAMAFTDLAMGSAVVDLCDGALTEPSNLSPELQVFALQQKAHGYSILADRDQVDESLDRAGSLMDRVDVEIWGTACIRTANYIEVQRATCYGRLGLAREADRLWSQIIPAAPASARRDVGVWSARQAVATLELGNPERALELARYAADVVRETGSARARRELANVDAAAAPWMTDPIGQDLKFATLLD